LAIWLGADPLVGSNVLLIAAFPLCAMAFCWTAYRFTGSVKAAFISRLAAGAPRRWGPEWLRRERVPFFPDIRYDLRSRFAGRGRTVGKRDGDTLQR
jgi:hypothetical protein